MYTSIIGYVTFLLFVSETDQIFYSSSNTSSKSHFHSGSSSVLEITGHGSHETETYVQSSKTGSKGKIGGTQRHFDRFFSGGNEGFAIDEHEYSVIRETSPRPGTCLAWGGSHYKTFDGKVYRYVSYAGLGNFSSKQRKTIFFYN